MSETLEELEGKLQEIEDAEADALKAYEKLRTDLENRIAKHYQELSSLSIFKFRQKEELQRRIAELQEELSQEKEKTQNALTVLRDEEYDLTLKIRRLQGDPII